MNILLPFIIFAILFEGFSAIPPSDLLWRDLGLGLTILFGIGLHIIVYNLCKDRGFSLVPALIGGFASVIGIIPILGTIAHAIAFAMYIKLFIRNKDTLLYGDAAVGQLRSNRYKNRDDTLSHDELTMIEGIGPVTAKLLIDSGIDTFGAIANLHPKDIVEFLAAHDLKGHDPSTWPEQAILARDGKWTDLKKWQDVLEGGREPHHMTNVSQ
jgi:hypothetical protein